MIKLKDIIFEKKKKGKDKLPPHLEKLIKDLKKKEKEFKKFGIKVTDVVVPGLEWMSEELLKEVKIVKFNSNEMDTLHKNGEIYKNDIVYQFEEEFVKEANVEPYQGFSSKEAKKVIDDGLRFWAKDLRKVQYRVIKDWMSKAKSGTIDYFDLVRGLETGDIARAKPFETKFLKGLLDRDKITDRFRSYFGGKKGKRGRRK